MCYFVFFFSFVLGPLLGQRIFMLRHMHECLTTIVILKALKPSAAINDKAFKNVMPCLAYKFAIIVVPLFFNTRYTNYCPMAAEMSQLMTIEEHILHHFGGFEHN